MNPEPGPGMNHEAFEGYPEPTANTLYCPNQFFDVVLPHSSRGVVRLVGYMLRRILGWSDADGRPQEPTVGVSWSELERNAGISNGAISEAINEAVAGRFIRCLRPGRPHSPGQVAVPALYELCWDDSGEYLTAPSEFRGFFAGNGNLTYIPNAFFDHTLKTEPLSVIRVVGTIIRNTIGWQTHYGFRRQRVEMSYTELQRRTHLSRPALNTALQQAMAHNHVERLEAGYFDTQAGRDSKAATYGLKWQGSTAQQPAEDRPADAAEAPDVAPQLPSVRKLNRAPEPHRSKNLTGPSVQEVNRKRSENLTGERSKKLTGLEITDPNNTSPKQQQQAEPAATPPFAAAARSVLQVEKDPDGAMAQLIQQGFDEQTATSLANQFSAERILRQCGWIGHRTAERNRLGLLRRAIEQDWPEPKPLESSGRRESGKAGDSPTPTLTPASVFSAYAYAGLAGNNAEPTAVPSPTDIEAARPFVDALLSLAPDEASVATWGRQFGSYVKQQVDRADRATPPRSVATALRTYGDAFQVAFRQRLESRRRQSQAERRKSHQEQFAAAHEAYLQERRDALRREHPELWERFLINEEEQRRKIAGMMPAGSVLRTRALESFDSEGEQLGRLLEFFKGSGDFPILSFWVWDSQVNPERLELQAA